MNSSLAQAQAIEQARTGPAAAFAGTPANGETTESLFNETPEVTAVPLEDPAPPVETPMKEEGSAADSSPPAPESTATEPAIETPTSGESTE